MASLSSAVNGKAFDSSHKDQGSDHEEWDFSIPTAEEQQHWARRAESRANGDSNEPKYTTRLADTDRPKNDSASKTLKPVHKVDPAYLSPYRDGMKLDLAGSRSGSEPDSLLDLYGHPRSVAERSMDSPQVRPEAQDPIDSEQIRDDDNDPETSRWIHRDKLAAIESQEMQAAGIVPPPQPKTSSRSKSRRGPSLDRRRNGSLDYEHESTLGQETKRRRVQSPPSPEEEDGEDLIHNFDIRTPEEIARDDAKNDGSTSPVYRQQGLRSSSSRIPLPTSSPMPLPQEHIERTTPLPRKRGASGNWSGGDDDGISFNRLRSRNNSMGSQVILDDLDALQYTPSRGADSRPDSSGSFSKAVYKTPSKSPHQRKTSTSNPVSTQRPRQASSTPRPKSRSGLELRPPTAINRPEGEAPWLKDMYKPDPRLPPDQQLLPTHARRLQEEQNRREQWEQAQRDSEERTKYSNSGSRRKQQQGIEKQQRDPNTDFATASTERDRNRDQEFSPLAEYTQNGLQPPTPSGSKDGPEDPSRIHHRDQGAAWPLTRDGTTSPPTQGTFNSETGGPTVQAGNAGYSTMPKLRGQQQGVENAYSANVTAGAGAGEGAGSAGAGKKGMDPFEREKLERAQEEFGDGDEKGTKKKKKKEGAGCTCCIVM